MGDKNEARATAKYKVPVTPGTEGTVDTIAEAKEEAKKLDIL